MIKPLLKIFDFFAPQKQGNGLKPLRLLRFSNIHSFNNRQKNKKINLIFNNY